MKAVAVISALRDESRTLDAVTDGGGESIDVWHEVSGIGPERARRTAARCAERGARGLVSWGVAGGLDPALRPGALILATEVAGEDGARHAVDGAWRERVERRLEAAGIHAIAGTLSESSRVLSSAADKCALFETTGAAAVDMESAAVASAAEKAGLPFLAVRTVCDEARTELPDCIVTNVDERGRPRLGALLGAIARRPSRVLALLRLKRDFGAALDTLRRVRELAGRELVSIAHEGAQ